MAQTQLPPPDPSGRVERTAERALLEQRLARLAARRQAGATGTPGASGGSSRAPSGGHARRHPAARARIAALGLSVASTAGLVGLFASGKTAGAGSGSTAAIVRSTANASSSADPATSAGAAATSTTSSAEATTTSTATTPSTQADEATATAAPSPATETVVDGAVFTNKWGNVQVEATFDASGALVDVVALQTPDDRSKSVRINDSAIPRLTAEALASQSASIDSISGATYTSDDYVRSLQSAIDAARAAGATTLA